MNKIEKIILPKAGSGEVFSFVEVDEALPKDGEVVIDVHYSGLNFADILMRQGLYPDAPPYPFTPGYEVSGIVERVGKSVTDLAIGDKVFAGCCFEGYAKKVILPAEQVCKVPSTLDLKRAAAIPVSYLTAYVALFDMGRVRDGDKILIDCATGGLGRACFQLLKNKDIEIVGLTSSKEKKELITSLGGIAYTHDEFEKKTNCENFNFILNSRGGVTIKKNLKRLAPTGKVLCLGLSDAIAGEKRNLFAVIMALLGTGLIGPIRLMNDNQGLLGLNLLRLFENPSFLVERLHNILNYDINPYVDKVFPYREIKQAQEYLSGRQSKGKILIEW